MGLGDGTLIDYKRHVFKYWIPASGKLKLAELRPHHVTETLGSIKTRRDKEREEALKANDAARAKAAEKDQVRVAKDSNARSSPASYGCPARSGRAPPRKVHATLWAALNAAVRAEEITRNVAAQAEKPRHRRKKVRPWQSEQLGRWLDSIAGLRLYPQIANVSYGKARRAIKAGQEPVYRTRPKTRDGEERTIDLDPDTIGVLKNWQHQQDQERAEWGPAYNNPDGISFTRENGDPNDPNIVYDTFIRTVGSLGFDKVPLHLLRHIAASLLIAAGVDIAIISKRLGHSKIDLTSDTYGHLIGKAGKNAAIAAAKLVPRGGQPVRQGSKKNKKQKPES